MRWLRANLSLQTDKSSLAGHGANGLGDSSARGRLDALSFGLIRSIRVQRRLVCCFDMFRRLEFSCYCPINTEEHTGSDVHVCIISRVE